MNCNFSLLFLKVALMGPTGVSSSTLLLLCVACFFFFLLFGVPAVGLLPRLVCFAMAARGGCFGDAVGNAAVEG